MICIVRRRRLAIIFLPFPDNRSNESEKLISFGTEWSSCVHSFTSKLNGSLTVQWFFFPHNFLIKSTGLEGWWINRRVMSYCILYWMWTLIKLCLFRTTCDKHFSLYLWRKVNWNKIYTKVNWLEINPIRKWLENGLKTVVNIYYFCDTWMWSRKVDELFSFFVGRRSC